MNLKELREEIADALKHGPDIVVYKDRIVRRINAAYLELCEEAQWNFLEQRVNADFLADVVLTNASYTNGSPVVTVSTQVPTGAWRDKRLIGADGVTYFIGYVDTSAGTLHLSSNYDGTTASGAAGTIYMDKWTLVDATGKPLGHVLDVVDRHDRSGATVLDHGKGIGKLKYISREREAGLNLNTQDTGQPTHYMVDPQEPNPAPDNPTAALSSGGTLTTGTTYNYFVRYYQGLIHSYRSEIVSLAPTSGNNTITLSALGSGLTANTGRRNQIYRSTGDSKVFQLISEQFSDVATYVDTGDTVTASTTRWSDPSPYERIQFWPRPSADMGGEVRYRRVPVRLEGDTDVPLLPSSFHRILVHIVMEQLAAEAEGGSLAKFHEKKKNELLARLRRRHLTRAPFSHQRGMWGHSDNVVVRPDLQLLDGAS